MKVRDSQSTWVRFRLGAWGSPSTGNLSELCLGE